MLDQFIAAGEDKWLRQSGLVMLLPHGYDGAGAEHSSCRVERYLQMVEEDPHYIPPMAHDERTQIQKTNWQVVNCSTPANYFHCLRRQIHRDFRKPLIVVAPKNLLRNKRAVSSLEDMGPETMFHRAYDETDESILSNPGDVKVRFLCTTTTFSLLFNGSTHQSIFKRHWCSALVKFTMNCVMNVKNWDATMLPLSALNRLHHLPLMRLPNFVPNMTKPRLSGLSKNQSEYTTSIIIC